MSAKLIHGIVFIILIFKLRCAIGLNILAVVTSASRSHTIFATTILDNMANNGHTVITFSPHILSTNFKSFNFDEHVDLYDYPLNSFLYDEKRRDLSDIYFEYKRGFERTKFVIKHPEFNNLLTQRIVFDLIVFDLDYNEALLGLSSYFNCPSVILTTKKQLTLLDSIIDINTVKNISKPTGYLENIENYFVNLYEYYFVKFYYYQNQKWLYDTTFHFINSDLIDVMKRSIKKVFVNLIPGESDIVSTEFVNVRGLSINHDDTATKFFPDKLTKFMDSALHGCIYVSLGSDINPLSLPHEIIYTILRILYLRPERIVWSWNGNFSKFENVGKFYFSKWFPQKKILSNQNVKLFITTGGRLSLTEAVHFGVPIIGIPLSRYHNEDIKNIVQHGYGIKMNFFNIDEMTLNMAIDNILNDKRYKRNFLNQTKLSMNNIYPTDVDTITNILENIVHTTHQSQRRNYPKTTNWHDGLYICSLYIISFIIFICMVWYSKFKIIVNFIHFKIINKGKGKIY